MTKPTPLTSTGAVSNKLCLIKKQTNVGVKKIWISYISYKSNQKRLIVYQLYITIFQYWIMENLKLKHSLQNPIMDDIIKHQLYPPPHILNPEVAISFVPKCNGHIQNSIWISILMKTVSFNTIYLSISKESKVYVFCEYCVANNLILIVCQTQG